MLKKATLNNNFIHKNKVKNPMIKYHIANLLNYIVLIVYKESSIKIVNEQDQVPYLVIYTILHV